FIWLLSSRSCQNLRLLPPSCRLPTKCSVPCSVICCTPPVSYPYMPRVSRVQYKTTCSPQSVPKPIKTVIYLPPCPTCSTSQPKMEMTYLPPAPTSPSSPPCFYVCSTNCVPCTPCPLPISCNSPRRPPLCHQFVTILPLIKINC
ncbi:uncharacterized protein, partial [Temnothorax nylanderi]|uniref:uncharacterized protein n=1 Tax=Temnothorax nylanderi TaxID=102681 RepID=UPI003A889445